MENILEEKKHNNLLTFDVHFKARNKSNEKLIDERRLGNGLKLIVAILKRSRQLNESTYQVAKTLGISHEFLIGIAKGENKVTDMNLDAVRKAADYIRLPLAQAVIMGGYFEPKDFFTDSDMSGRIEIAYKSLVKDPALCDFAVNNEVWSSLNPEVKFLIASLHESNKKSNHLKLV
jgi:transcriptional regulator with XRE-family HTH domain